MGNVGTKTSWHNQYRDSAWCFYGGMPFELTEGDIICIFEQLAIFFFHFAFILIFYGEIISLKSVFVYMNISKSKF